MNVQDRVVEMRLVPASELSAHPSNWRQHPKAQQRALTAILDEVGFAGAVLARENDDGQLIIIDGHARAEIVGDATIPVLVTDLTEAEAEIVLATYDPIGAMAQQDAEALERLLARVTTDNTEIQDLLDSVANGYDPLTIGEPATLGAEITEDIAAGIELCVCPICKHEHHHAQ